MSEETGFPEVTDAQLSDLVKRTPQEPNPSIAFIEGEIADCHQIRAECKIQLAQLQQQANQIIARQQQLDQKQAGYEATLAALKG